MKPIFFELVPFKATQQTDALSLHGKVTRTQHHLSIQYQLSGDLNSVNIPSIGTGGDRRDRLWEKTCFEYFLRLADRSQTRYWEINLSPCGDWNVFSLSNYRDDLQAEMAIAHIPFQVNLAPNELQLDISMDIAPLVGNQNIQVGISTVLIIAGEKSYWAIAHPAPQADFHHPDSFAIPLTA